MWYNPVIYTTNVGFTDTEILWFIYQHLTATTSLLFAVLIIWISAKALLWLLPNFGRKAKE